MAISDIHFNPFAGCGLVTLQSCPMAETLDQSPVSNWDAILAAHVTKMTTVGHDTNYLLLQSFMQEISQLKQTDHPIFVLFLGDALAHDFRIRYILTTHQKSKASYDRFVAKTMQYLTLKLKGALPDTDVYPVVGNNDSYTGDYDVVPEGQFFKDSAKLWSGLILTPAGKKSFLTNYPQAGFYAFTLPEQSQYKVLVLNSVLFSSRAQSPAVARAARVQLAWLQTELQTAKVQHQKVLIAFHIPIGIDVYKTITSFFTRVQEFWMPAYTQAFKKILGDNTNVVTGILAGHLHMDSFEILTTNSVDKIPVSIVPAVSPIFGNNPGFKMYRYDASTFKLNNYETYYYPLNTDKKWEKEYSFEAIYQHECHDCEVLKGMLTLTTDHLYLYFFQKFYSVGREPLYQEPKWLAYYWCSIRTITRPTFETCLKH